MNCAVALIKCFSHENVNVNQEKCAGNVLKWHSKMIGSRNIRMKRKNILEILNIIV